MSASKPEKPPLEAWASDMQTIMDEMRRRKMCDYRASGTWSPAVNIYEAADGFHVCVLLAGVQPEMVTIECRDGCRVHIAGARTRPLLAELGSELSVAVLEIDEGAFEREVELTARVDEQNVAVRHQDGFLWITLRKIRTR